MQYLLSVKSRADQRFEASVVSVPSCIGEGHSREEAIEQATSCLEKHLAKGDLVEIQVDTLSNDNKNKPEGSGMNYAGALALDPTFDDFMEKLTEIRREANLSSDNT